MPKLTNSLVLALDKRESDYTAWCSELTGFGCRVRPSGRKSFIAQYRVGGGSGPVRKFTIGTYPELTANQARDRAKEVLANARLGVDQGADRARKRAEMTVAGVCDEYLREGCGHKKASTVATDRGRISRHIVPLLGKKKIGDVSKADVERFVQDVATGKTAVVERTSKFGLARVSGGQGTANRTARLLGGIFTFAVERGYIEKNPRSGVKLPRDNKGERFLLPDEIRRLGEALHEAETVGLPWQFNEGKLAKHRPALAENQREKIDPYAIAAIRLLLLTGCRASEILTLQWKFVDPRGYLHLPDSKSGAKVVMLGAPALQIIGGINRMADNPYVIVGEAKDKPRYDLKRPWKRISTHAGLGDVRLHDLRHSFASVAATSGMGLAMVGKLLGHSSPTTTQRYAHFADDPFRAAADLTATKIAADLTPRDEA